MSAACVVDTDVFSLLYVRRGTSDARIGPWREYLTGRSVVISFQTRAELLAGARVDGWGEPRLSNLIQLLDKTPTIGATRDVIDTYANLVRECRQIGHALHDKGHAGDRWIAASAIAKHVELLAGDGIFIGAPNLTLRN